LSSVTLTGVSGSKYVYEAFPYATTSWNDIPGNYAFAYQAQNNMWPILYVGQCDSFQKRIPNHERWAEAAKAGATHVLAHSNTNGELARQAEEQDVIGHHQPPLNTQHMRRAG